jgi:hypothetical protein
MRCTLELTRCLGFALLAAVLSLAGCTDMASLCQAHLIPINVPAEPGTSPQAKVPLP